MDYKQKKSWLKANALLIPNDINTQFDPDKVFMVEYLSTVYLLPVSLKDYVERWIVK